MQQHTRSKRSTSPMTTASGASQVSGAIVGMRLPSAMSCRCLQRCEAVLPQHRAGGLADA